MEQRAGTMALGKEDWILGGFRALARGGQAAVKVEALARELGATKRRGFPDRPTGRRRGTAARARRVGLDCRNPRPDASGGALGPAETAGDVRTSRLSHGRSYRRPCRRSVDPAPQFQVSRTLSLGCAITCLGRCAAGQQAPTSTDAPSGTDAKVLVVIPVASCPHLLKAGHYRSAGLHNWMTRCWFTCCRFSALGRLETLDLRADRQTKPCLRKRPDSCSDVEWAKTASCPSLMQTTGRIGERSPDVDDIGGSDKQMIVNRSTPFDRDRSGSKELAFATTELVSFWKWSQ